MQQSKNCIKIFATFVLILFWTLPTIAKIRKRAVQPPKRTQPITIKKMTAAEEIAAAREEAQTQLLKKERKKNCYDVAMLFDEIGDEPINGNSHRLSFELISSFTQKSFPIIVSSSTVYNFCFHKTTFKEIVLSLNAPANKAPILISFDLTHDDWYCYDHPEADIMLFIPKGYAAQFTDASSKNNDDILKECGFNPTHLKKIDRFSPDILFQYLKDKSHKKPKLPTIIALESLFLIPSRPNPRTWNIYLAGHGNTDYSIAGLYKSNFLQLLSVLQKINCSFLHYVTCYAGGFNQNMVKDQLSDLKVNFIVSTQGINESLTYGAFFGSPYITDFFKMTEFFFGNPIQFIEQGVRQKNWQKDPIATIVKTVIDTTQLDFTQPFVYLPTVGVFNALKVDDSVKIITESLAKAYAFEDKVIDFTAPGITTAIIYPNYIAIPLKMKSNIAIVSPTKPGPTLVLPKNAKADLHILEHVIYNGTLSFLIPNFVVFNQKIGMTTFVIKKLECFDYKNSGLGNEYKKPISIENMIICYYTDLSTSVISVFFDFNKKSYLLKLSLIGYDDPYQFRKALFGEFKTLPAQLIQQNNMDTLFTDILPYYLKTTSATSPKTLSDIATLLEATIDKTTQVQERGSLKKILLRKQEQIRQEQSWSDYFSTKIKRFLNYFKRPKKIQAKKGT